MQYYQYQSHNHSSIFCQILSQFLSPLQIPGQSHYPGSPTAWAAGGHTGEREEAADTQ